MISEVYFPEGWKLFIDDKPVKNVYKTDHAIQSVVVPGGNHKIRMKFIPGVYANSRLISSVSSILLYIVIVLLFVFHFRGKQNSKKNPEITPSS